MTAKPFPNSLKKHLRLRPFVFAVLALFSIDVLTAQESLPLLTKAKAVRELSQQEAKRGYLVRLRGVVTGYDAPRNILFIQDSTAGVSIDSSGQSLRVEVGQLVEVEGRSAPGNFASIITKPKLRLLGADTMPIANPVNREEWKGGLLESQWVEIQGVIRKVSESAGQILLEVASTGDRIYKARIAKVTETSVPPVELVDALVRIQGVGNALFNQRDQFVGMELLVPTWTEVRVKTPAPADPFWISTQAINALRLLVPVKGPSHRVKVQGVVTCQRLGKSLCIQDETGGLFAQTQQTTAVQPGDYVEVVGFRDSDPYSLNLQNAVFRQIGTGPLPTPVSVTVEQVLEGSYDGRLVRIEGQLSKAYLRRSNLILVLHAGTSIFHAEQEANLDAASAEDTLASLAPGSRLQLTGACRLLTDEQGTPRSFRIMLRSAGDVLVLERPAWWTVKRVQAALGIMGVIILAAAGWAMSLKKARERFRTLIENSSDGVLILDREGIIRYASPSTRALGYSLAGYVGRMVNEFIHPDDSARVLGLLTDVLGESGKTHRAELRYRHKNGSWRWLEVVSQNLLSDPNVNGVLCNFRDIDDRKQAEEALWKKETSLIQAQRIGQIGSWEVDLVKDTLEWSEETYRIFGLQPGECVPSNQSFLERVPSEDRERVGKAIEDAVRMGSPYAIDHRIIRADGSERVVHEEAIIVFDPQGQAVRMIGTVQDNTERQKLEAQLRQAQKMNSIGQLAGGVAHDFNNLLTVIQGHIGLLLADESLSRRVMDSVGEIALAAERAANLTRQLLTFSRGQAIQPAPLELNQVVANVMKMLQRILGEDVVLQLNYTPKLPRIHADQGMLEQILMNLAVNSRDAMPNGGRLFISTTELRADEDYVRINPEASVGRFVCLEVSDTGCGIPAEQLPLIFEPFFTTKAVGHGTGLGLATVYGIVKQHQGWIKVYSEAGHGTSFRIFIPATEAKPMGKTEVVPTKIRGGNETILVVEDTPSVSELVRCILERYGYDLLEASDGPSALEVWSSHKNEIQLLLTDLVMPNGMTGLELAEKLQSEKPDLKVIYTSGYSADVVAPGFLVHEEINFLQKPYNPLKLAGTVRRCLDGTSAGKTATPELSVSLA